MSAAVYPSIDGGNIVSADVSQWETPPIDAYIENSAHGSQHEDWPSIVPLDASEPPRFPAESLVGPVGDMVRAVARATETPLELAFSFALATLSTACQKTFIVQPEQGWQEPVNLWMVCALPPGNRKTAVQKEMGRPILDWERDQGDIVEQEIKAARSKRESQEVRIKALRKKASVATEEKYRQLESDIMDMESKLIEVPCSPRLVVQDVTPEFLGEMMAKHDERMAIISDEGGIFETLGGRYSGGVPNLDHFFTISLGFNGTCRPPIPSVDQHGKSFLGDGSESSA